jgi:hypothetical protein
MTMCNPSSPAAARDFVAEALENPIADIGQIDDAGKRALARAVRAGTLAKWRGRWYPETGASYGLGPLKSCYGRPEMGEYYSRKYAHA